MSENQPVNPAEVPVFTGDLELLDEKVKALSGAGGKIATAAGDVHSSFGGLSAFYKAPEADQLFATTQPVKDKALTISSDMCTIAGALGTYASDIRPLKQKLDDLRQDAVAFRQKIAEDDKWREDGDLVEENNNRRNEIAEVWTQFQAAERAAHAKIVALVGGKALKVNDGSNGEGMYGYDAEALKQAKSLPWGDAVEESTPWWQVWEHAYDFGKGIVVDGVWGTIKGLGTLVGFQGWDAAGQAWKGLGLLATGLVITASPLGAAYWMADDKDLPGWIRDSRTAMKETGKALVAWDQWGSNPARAAGAVTFNVLTTVFTGGAGGAVSGAGKAGAAARAISFAGKAGRAIDPTTYLFKGAGAGITKIGDVMTGLKGMGNIDLPPIPEGTVVLPEGSLMRPDGTIHLPDGTPVPPGAIEVPRDAVRLPEGAPVPPGAVDLGDGVVKLPDDVPAPAGSVPLQEGTVALPKDTPTLPPDANPLPVREGDPARYLDGEGNILDENGNVVSSAEDAPPDVVDRGTDPDAAPTTGADNPRVDTPAKVPAMAGAAVHAGDNTAIHLGNSLDTNLGDVGRVGDDLPTHVPDTPGGLADNTPGGLADNLPTGQAGDNLPGGGAGDQLPTNSLDNTPTGGADHVPGGHGDGPTGGGGDETPAGGGHGDGPGGNGPGGDGPGGNGPDGPDGTDGPDGPNGPEDPSWARPTEDSGPFERGGETEQQIRDQLRGTKVKPGDVDAILKTLAGHPAGKEIAETIASGRYKDSYGFSTVVSNLSRPSEVPGSLEQIRLANRLHESGLTDISFEVKQGGHEIKPGVFTEVKTDLDVMARDANGNVHGWQFKDMTGVDSTTNPSKVVDKMFKNIGQLTDSHADVQTFVVDTKVAKSDMATQIGRLQKGYEGKNVQFVIRTPDGIIFVPRDGKFMPEGTL
ncbi:hypothetical protein [Streptomyces sp. NPDC000229]|uniref:hypothetical protein n=1 Tax=Streptomyces sp. NPDC000229 TaxID=3154247 RepID=UPI00331D1336